MVCESADLEAHGVCQQLSPKASNPDHEFPPEFIVVQTSTSGSDFTVARTSPHT
jgi:hypothetical protein